jgi:hypothetical protein
MLLKMMLIIELKTAASLLNLPLIADEPYHLSW